MSTNPEQIHAICASLRELAEAAYHRWHFILWGHLTDAAKLLEEAYGQIANKRGGAGDFGDLPLYLDCDGSRKNPSRRDAEEETTS